MGGTGSGRWRTHTKAQTVEDCVIFLDTSTFHPNFQLWGHATRGTLTWTSCSGQALASASYILEHVGPDNGLLRLVFIVEAQGRQGVVESQIPLKPERPHYGGRLWWFMCPRCGGRARKLYMPPDEMRFGCRCCHDLTYRSSQESHTLSGVFNRLWRLGLLPSLGRP